MNTEQRCHRLHLFLTLSGLGVSIIALLMATILLLPLPASAEIYKWTDASGDLHFTDDPASIPKKYRNSVIVDSDSGENSAVMQEVDNQKTIETLERKQAELPPGQVLPEQDVRALLEARKRVGR
jgi:hypothetical protein